MGSTEVISSHVLELHQLISAPLVATIDADTMVSRRYFEFLTEVAFEKKDESGHLGDLRTVSFSYEQHDINGTTSKQVTIPVISLIPLPLLQVKDASFDFEIKIVDAVSETTSKQRYDFKAGENADAGNKTAPGNDLKLRASLAPKSGSGSKSTNNQSLTANMHVKVNMQPADLPGGLAALLQLTASNMKIKDTESNPKSTQTLST